MSSSHLILCHPLLLLNSIFPSIIRVFSKESVLCIRWWKYWSFSFSFSISPSNEYSGLISLRIDWLDLLAVQGTLKSLLQLHSSKASILQLLAFFMVHLSNPSRAAFCMMYSAYKLNMQDVSIQPWYTPFPIWNQSCYMFGYNCCFLTWIQISQKAGKVVWYSHLSKDIPQFFCDTQSKALFLGVPKPL